MRRVIRTIGWVALLCGLVLAGRCARSVSADGFIDFEDGVDRQPIQSSIPGLHFTTTEGYDWIYADWRSGEYNGPYPDGNYTSHGNFFAWLGENQGAGRIDFTESGATYLQVWVSTLSGLYMDAYAEDGRLLDSTYVGSNYDTGQLSRLRADAPAGERISYVIIHDTGNRWLIDDLSTDAGGVPEAGPPVVVVPGIQGTALNHTDACVPGDEPDEVWPAPWKLVDPFDSHLDTLKLAPDGIAPCNDSIGIGISPEGD